MENPATWTPLHHALSANISNPIALVSILKTHGHDASIEDVLRIIDQFQQDTRPGLSLPARLVSGIVKENK